MYLNLSGVGVSAGGTIIIFVIIITKIIVIIVIITIVIIIIFVIMYLSGVGVSAGGAISEAWTEPIVGGGQKGSEITLFWHLTFDSSFDRLQRTSPHILSISLLDNETKIKSNLRHGMAWWGRPEGLWNYPFMTWHLTLIQYWLIEDLLSHILSKLISWLPRQKLFSDAKGPAPRRSPFLCPHVFQARDCVTQHQSKRQSWQPKSKLLPTLTLTKREPGQD